MTDKITLATVGSISQNPTSAATTINSNFSTIQTAFDNTLSRDGTQPNTMGSNLDMNNNRVVNLPKPLSANEPLRLQDASTLNGGGTINSIPSGGVTGQILSKISNTDFDANWSNVSSVVTAGNNITTTGTGVVTVSTVSSPTFVGANLSGLTANTSIQTDSSKNLVSLANTGTGNNVLATSPILSGTPTATTASVDTNTAQIATTAFVLGQSATTTPTMDGSASTGTSTRYARADHVHPSDTSRQAADPQLFSNIPQNSQSVNYTLVLTDGEKQIFHPSSDNNARTFTIPANASVAFPIGTVITFINKINTLTISITTDTLTQAGSGSTGSRTLAANGLATAIKISSTEWMISGSGLS